MTNNTFSYADIRAALMTEGDDKIGARGVLPLSKIAAFVLANPDATFVDTHGAASSAVTVSPVESVDAGSVLVWGVLNGFADDIAAARGKVSDELASAFNDAHDGEFYSAEPIVSIETPGGESKVATVAQVREWARENGFDLRAGRTPHAVFAAYVAADADATA